MPWFVAKSTWEGVYFTWRMPLLETLWLVVNIWTTRTDMLKIRFVIIIPCRVLQRRRNPHNRSAVCGRGNGRIQHIWPTANWSQHWWSRWEWQAFNGTERKKEYDQNGHDIGNHFVDATVNKVGSLAHDCCRASSGVALSLEMMCMALTMPQYQKRLILYGIACSLQPSTYFYCPVASGQTKLAWTYEISPKFDPALCWSIRLEDRDRIAPADFFRIG